MWQEVLRPECIFWQRDVSGHCAVVEGEDLVLMLKLVVDRHPRPDPIGQLVCQRLGAQHHQVQVVRVGRAWAVGPRSGPTRRSLLGSHDPLDQGVGAVGVSVAMLAHRTGDEAQVLEEQELPVCIQSVKGLKPGKSKQKHTIILTNQLIFARHNISSNHITS